ncbi:hypothetical protein SAMN06309944_0103 [Micrococcales bacterium KH10]|nr:hypothetical protein SAMN06309944_0103 [Micrococcales bacterium KH10]
MKKLRGFAGIALLSILATGMAVAVPATAAASTPKCDTSRAENLLNKHGVTIPQGYSVGAYLDNQEKKTYCTVWVSDLDTGRHSITLKLSKNTADLWSTHTERLVKRTHTATEVYTAAGRRAFKTKTVRFQQKTVSKKKQMKRTTTFRNTNGSAGKRVATTKSNASSWSSRIVITLTSKKGKKTKVTVRDTCRVNAATPRCTGKQTSKHKAYRGTFNVVLQEKSSQGLNVSHGIARSGPGRAAYNRVYRLEQKRFGAERNGYARGR